MNRKHISLLPVLGVLLIGLSFWGTGCELDTLSSGELDGQNSISLSELNGTTQSTASETTANTETASDDQGQTSTTTTEETVTTPTPAPTPTPTPTPTPSPNSPRYSPGEVVIPSEFLTHGTMTELRFQYCSVANGRMKKISSTVYSLPPPSDPVWSQTGANGSTEIGTRAKFADGAIFDGYVRNYNMSYSMPIQAIGRTSGGAFWVRMK
jgi:hypothetical protein